MPSCRCELFISTSIKFADGCHLVRRTTWDRPSTVLFVSATLDLCADLSCLRVGSRLVLTRFLLDRWRSGRCIYYSWRAVLQPGRGGIRPETTKPVSESLRFPRDISSVHGHWLGIAFRCNPRSNMMVCGLSADHPARGPLQLGTFAGHRSGKHPTAA